MKNTLAICGYGANLQTKFLELKVKCAAWILATTGKMANDTTQSTQGKEAARCMSSVSLMCTWDTVIRG